VGKQGVSKWGRGVKGEDTGGVDPLSLGARGLCPRKIFQITGDFKRIFQTKISALTPVFMPVNFGKVPNPFDF
jgi:hypothetical protein